MSKKDDEDREWWERWLDDSLEEISLDNFDWDEARKRSMKKQFQEALKAWRTGGTTTKEKEKEEKQEKKVSAHAYH